MAEITYHNKQLDALGLLSHTSEVKQILYGGL